MIDRLMSHLLVMKMDFTRNKVIALLFETEGKISQEKLISKIEKDPVMIERLFLQILIVNAVKMIREGAMPLTSARLKKLLKQYACGDNALNREYIRQEADLELLELVEYFFKGKLALRNDPASIEAICYSLEMEEKKPLSYHDREILKKLSDSMTGMGSGIPLQKRQIGAPAEEFS